MQCSFIKTDGKQCKANAINSDDLVLCCFHNPNYAEQRKKALVKGGRKREHIEVAHEPIICDNLEVLVLILSETINNARMSDYSPSQARIVIASVEAMAKLIEMRDIQKQLDDIEQLLNEQNAYGNFINGEYHEST